MPLQIVSLDRVPEQPWRNGGGVTRELLAWPPGPDWQWRLSVAEITQDGPFSAFPGVVRWFAVLEGNGVVLHFADRRVRLDAQTAPLPFDGAAAPHCVLQGGATRDPT
jgi:environmental stress-induced protein Ves